jgi:hypothetical protein
LSVSSQNVEDEDKGGDLKVRNKKTEVEMIWRVSAKMK